MATQFDKVPAGTSGRIKRILLSPKAEWPVIDSEATTTRALMTGWVLPLAAIGPVCLLIGSLVFGYSFLGIHFHPTIGSAISEAVVRYITAVIGVWVLALVIDALAPSFAGTKNPVQAMKVAAYSMTAAWVAQAFFIIPELSILAMLLGLYSFYLLYLGLPLLMKTPPDRALGYLVVTIVVAIVLFLIVGAIAAAAANVFAPAPVLGTAGSISLR